MAIQATIASIRQPEIHAAIQTHNLAVINEGLHDEPGQLLLHVLGITEWFSIRILRLDRVVLLLTQPSSSVKDQLR